MSEPSQGRPTPRDTPEGAETSDPFGWLYRGEQTRDAGAGAPPVDYPPSPYPPYPGPPAAPSAPAPSAPAPSTPVPSTPVPSTPVPSTPAPSAPARPAEPSLSDDDGPGLATQVFSLGTPPPTVRHPEALPTMLVTGSDRDNSTTVIAVIVVAVVLLVALIGGAYVLLRPTSAPPPVVPEPSRSTVSEPSGDPSTAPPPLTYEAITATGAEADCVAPDGIDGAGKAVPYDPANVIDDDPSTAWRCDGDGIDQQITLTLPGSTVAQLGFVNGYAKVDPADGSNRYPEYRRVLEVEWVLSNGATFRQSAKDGTEGLQTLDIPPQADITSVQLIVKRTTAPGLPDKSRNSVLISTIQVSSPA